MSDSILLSTGYATITREIMKRLAKEYDVTHFGWQFVGNPLKFYPDEEVVSYANKHGGIKLLPNPGNHPFGANMLQNYLRMENPDLFWCLCDSFMLFDWINNIDFAPAKSMFYFPSDGEYFPFGCENVLKKFQYVIAMSKFAQSQIKRLFNIDVDYIPHGCFFEDTEIQTISKNLKIKDIVDKKELKLIQGFNKVGLTNIEEYHKIKLKDSMLFIITETGKYIEITKDNPILTNNLKYKSAGSLNIEKDFVYTPIGIYNTKENNDYELGISGRNNRRGRKYKSDSLQQTKKECYSSFTKNIYNKFESRVKDFLRIEWLENKQTFSEQINKKGLLSSRNKRIKNIPHINRYTSISPNKKEASRIIDKILKNANSKEMAWEIHRRRTNDSETNKRIKPEKIIVIIEFIPTYEYVYDLTTTSHNFIANGIIVHNCDTEFFKPADEVTKRQLRDKWSPRLQTDLQDKFVITSVGRNQGRKALPEFLKVLGRFVKGKEDKVRIILHCDPEDPAGIGPPQWLFSLLQRYGLEHVVRFSGTKVWFQFPFEDYREMYQIADIHALATTGEGFGIPTIESQSCGLPNVITDYTTSKELVGEPKSGIIVPTAYELTGTWTVERGFVDHDKMVDALETLYKDENLRKEMSKRARENALNYDWNKIVFPMWSKKISEILEE